MKKFYTLVTFFLLLTCVSCEKASKKGDQRLRLNFQQGDHPSVHPHDLIVHLQRLTLSKMLFEPLTRINHEGKVELAGAKSVHLSSDHLTYTFILREQAWSNGKPVTAQQYEMAWKAALAPDSNCLHAEIFYAIKNAEAAQTGKIPLEKVGIKAIDAQTLVIDLDHPSPYFLELVALAAPFPLPDPEKKQQSVFNGPFVISEWKKGGYLRLKPNPYYWDRMHIELKGIDISFIEDVDTVFSLYEKGEMDWIGVPLSPLSSEIIHRLKDNFTLKSQPIGRSFWIFLNTEHPALRSSFIRQALSLALERELVTRQILIGGEPSHKALSEQMIPRSSTHDIKEDVDEARRRFDQGLTELGFTRETFPPLEISFCEQTNHKQLAMYLQERWHHTLGIDIYLKGEEENALRVHLENGLFAISMAYEDAYYRDPLALLERYTKKNSSNFSRWQDATFVKKIIRAKHEKNEGNRKKLLEEAEDILTDHMPIIPICSDRFLFAHTPKLKGYIIDSLGAIDFSRASKNFDSSSVN